MHTRQLPSPTTASWQWQVAAACRGFPSAFFFHPWGERGTERADRVRRAKEVCAGCPVVDECLRHALQAREMYGVWGGLSEDERLILLGLHRRHRTSPVGLERADDGEPARSAPSATRAR